MAKQPPNTPDKWERVTLRGRKLRAGTLTRWDPEAPPESRWCTVEWDDGGGPKIAHLFELERA